MNTPDYIAVLDFEATCEERSRKSDWDPYRPEIIEFPVCLIDTQALEVVATFQRFVRPVEQPVLTNFCTELTSIRQEQLEGQPTIGEVMVDFERWCNEHGLTPENCCVATCGDWDLRRMWSKQVALCPELNTPALFKQWCNLKVIFSRQEGLKAPGMMGMLRHAGIPHVGIHHRGIDDVRNLCELTLWMLKQGTEVVATWGEPQRQSEIAYFTKKLAGKEKHFREMRLALKRLPEDASPSVRERYETTLANLTRELNQLRARKAVFEGPSN